MTVNDDIDARLRKIAREHYQVESAAFGLKPGIDSARLMHRLFDETGATGRLTTDIHLAALAIELGAGLATTDVDFARFSEAVLRKR